jgi:hypothetical protein
MIWLRFGKGLLDMVNILEGVLQWKIVEAYCSLHYG